MGVRKKHMLSSPIMWVLLILPRESKEALDAKTGAVCSSTCVVKDGKAVNHPRGSTEPEIYQRYRCVAKFCRVKELKLQR